MSKLTFFVIFAVVNQYVFSVTDDISGSFGKKYTLNVSDSRFISITYESVN